MVTSVAPSDSAKVVVTVMGPASSGASVSNSTTSTIRSPGTSSTKVPRNVSVCRSLLPGTS